LLPATNSIKQTGNQRGRGRLPEKTNITSRWNKIEQGAGELPKRALTEIGRRVVRGGVASTGSAGRASATCVGSSSPAGAAAARTPESRTAIINREPRTQHKHESRTNPGRDGPRTQHKQAGEEAAEVALGIAPR